MHRIEERDGLGDGALDQRFLCKAKQKAGETWKEGFLVAETGTGKVYICENVKSMETKDGEACLEIRGFEVEPATVCRYTGMKDRNGKKIWEHDMVRANERSWGEWMDNEVVYRFGCIRLFKEGYCDALLCRYMAKDLEVTGHIMGGI